MFLLGLCVIQKFVKIPPICPRKIPYVMALLRNSIKLRMSTPIYCTPNFTDGSKDNDRVAYGQYAYIFSNFCPPQTKFG